MRDRHAQAHAKHGRVSPAPANKLLGNCKRLINQIEHGIDQIHLSALANLDDGMIVCTETIKSLKRVLSELERIKRVQQQMPSQAPMVPALMPQQQA